MTEMNTSRDQELRRLNEDGKLSQFLYYPARELCRLRCDQVKLGKRSGSLEIIGKRNKYREVPLNATARKVLEEYLPDTFFLFPSAKTKEALSERALGYIIKKYARVAKLLDVSPHDLRHRFAIAWRSLSRSIGWRKSWVMIRWIPPRCIFKGPSTTYNRRLRRLHGHTLEEKKR